MTTLDKTRGCLLGLALGDAYGAPFEGGILERTVWRLIGSTRNGELRWTDDTQMTIDTVESFLAQGHIDPNDMAIRFARSYRWSRGYGPGAAKVLRRIAAGKPWREASRSVYPTGSFGNGAAMRAPIFGLIFSGHPTEMREATESCAAITHAHPLGVEGAILIAQATACAVCDVAGRDMLNEVQSRVTCDEFATRLTQARTWLERQDLVSPKEVARHLGNGIAAHQSCVTAIYLALRFRDDSFAAMHRFVTSCRGDVDTIGAMAGAIWGAFNGHARLPTSLLNKLEQRDRLTDLGASLHQRLVPMGEPAPDRST